MFLGCLSIFLGFRGAEYRRTISNPNTAPTLSLIEAKDSNANRADKQATLRGTAHMQDASKSFRPNSQLCRNC